jgi:hypothetical protein
MERGCSVGNPADPLFALPFFDKWNAHARIGRTAGGFIMAFLRSIEQIVKAYQETGDSMMRSQSFLVMLLFISFTSFLTACVTTEKHKPESNLVTLRVSFADPLWDGKTIPEGQQCNRFGGDGATPRLTVKNIPSGTNAIIMEYSDRDWPQMDDGGHGKIGYRIPLRTTEVTIPSVPGQTFDLPDGFFLVEAHRSTRGVAGAYKPPCSGGWGHSYYVTVKAVYDASSKNEESRLLGKAKIELGKY